MIYSQTAVGDVLVQLKTCMQINIHLCALRILQSAILHYITQAIQFCNTSEESKKFRNKYNLCTLMFFYKSFDVKKLVQSERYIT